MKRKAALSIITAAFLIGVAACGNGNINSSGAAASNENSALQQSDAAENSTRKTSATEENADTEDASTENNADSNTDTEESAQNAQEQKTPRGLHLRILQNISSSFAVARVDGLRILPLIPTVISVVNIMIPIWELPGTAMKTEPCI